MHNNPARRAAAFLILLTLCIAAVAQDNPAPKPPPPAPPSQTVPGSQAAAGTPRITGLLLAPAGIAAAGHVALNDKLAVVLDTIRPPHPADQYVLFLNDTEVQGLAPATYTTVNGAHALVFKLVRNADNAAFWRELLGAPKRLTIPVTVALGERAQPCQSGHPCKSPDITIVGATAPASFDFELISREWLVVALVAVGLVIFLVWGHARRSTTLRDNLLPQLAPQIQPYSLARWQMAFWFVLVFASFIFLYILLWDYNTVSTQALALMGISAATALASVAVDVAKDSPADAANRALRALGLNTYADVLRVRSEIAVREQQVLEVGRDCAEKQAAAALAKAAARGATRDAHLAAAAKAAAGLADSADRRLEQLRGEIQDRKNTLRTYDDKTRPFASEGWLKDLTTDLNGPTVHRIQVLCWTVALGLVFVVGVYRELSMPPDFSPTLLALLGISSAGYVGFKFPEKNN